MMDFASLPLTELIRPEGFDPWLDSGRDKTARFVEIPLRPGRVSWAKAQMES